mmetsp:Transcript_3721/g.5077  ORF Transcript_3721/g.5077 Transcript_3721/m.5077 type:complete len:97 (-) Transcript_3721:33-323(-)
MSKVFKLFQSVSNLDSSYVIREVTYCDQSNICNCQPFHFVRTAGSRRTTQSVRAYVHTIYYEVRVCDKDPHASMQQQLVTSSRPFQIKLQTSTIGT